MQDAWCVEPDHLLCEDVFFSFIFGSSAHFGTEEWRAWMICGDLVEFLYNVTDCISLDHRSVATNNQVMSAKWREWIRVMSGIRKLPRLHLVLQPRRQRASLANATLRSKRLSWPFARSQKKVVDLHDWMRLMKWPWNLLRRRAMFWWNYMTKFFWVSHRLSYEGVAWCSNTNRKIKYRIRQEIARWIY